MFYNYLNSIYNILQNHEYNSATFEQMLYINKQLINNKFIQYGGNNNTVQNANIKSMESIAKILANEMQKYNNQMTTVMNNTNIASVDVNTKFEELKEQIKKTVNVLTLFINYIEMIHSIAPNSENIGILKEQMNDIHKILSKYI